MNKKILSPETQKELEMLSSIYNKDVRSSSFRAIILGESGTGKTYMLRTCPPPVHVDSFDPGGTQSLDDAIARGTVFADTRFEVDNPKMPSAFDLFDREFHRRKAAGYFAEIGTYCLDSLTTLAKAALLKILKLKGRPGGVPQQDDWLPQMTLIENVIQEISSLPCNVIVTGHLDIKEDAVTKQLLMRPMITGKLTTRIPLLFSEIYVAEAKDTSRGICYSLLTQSTGRYLARTRLGKGGIFQIREEPNITNLLEKAKKALEITNSNEKETTDE